MRREPASQPWLDVLGVKGDEDRWQKLSDEEALDKEKA